MSKLKTTAIVVGSVALGAGLMYLLRPAKVEYQQPAAIYAPYAPVINEPVSTIPSQPAPKVSTNPSTQQAALDQLKPGQYFMLDSDGNVVPLK